MLRYFWLYCFYYPTIQLYTCIYIYIHYVTRSSYYPATMNGPGTRIRIVPVESTFQGTEKHCPRSRHDLRQHHAAREKGLSARGLLRRSVSVTGNLGVSENDACRNNGGWWWFNEVKHILTKNLWDMMGYVHKKMGGSRNWGSLDPQVTLGFNTT